MILTTKELEKMDKLPRVQLATTLPGPKPICLVGTRCRQGKANLAPYSSVTHLGSDPVLIGMVTRPDLVDRHTLRNILETGEWTLNHLTADIVGKGHHCSARYPAETSEFEASGLTEHHRPGFHSPFVAESPLRIGLALEQVIDITANDTRLVVGRVTLVDLPGREPAGDGSIDLAELGSLASTALDTYFTVSALTRLPHAKPGASANGS